MTNQCQCRDTNFVKMNCHEIDVAQLSDVVGTCNCFFLESLDDFDLAIYSWFSANTAPKVRIFTTLIFDHFVKDQPTITLIQNKRASSLPRQNMLSKSSLDCRISQFLQCYFLSVTISLTNKIVKIFDNDPALVLSLTSLVHKITSV